MFNYIIEMVVHPRGFLHNAHPTKNYLNDRALTLCGSYESCFSRKDNQVRLEASVQEGDNRGELHGRRKRAV